MRRFKEFTIQISDISGDDMGIKSESIKAKLSIDLLQVESFREQTPNRSDELIFLTVYMKSGEYFTIMDCNYSDFKEIITEFNFEFKN